MPENTNLTQANVTTGKPYSGGIEGLAAGSIFVGAEGAELPTDPTKPLPDNYKCFGYISDAGVGNSIDSSSTEIKAWGGATILQSLDSFSESWNWTCSEINETVLDTVWGNVTGSVAEGLSVDHGPAGFSRIRPYVIVTAYMDGSVAMHIIPRGQLTNVDAISYNDTDVVGHSVTIGANAGGFPDAPDVSSRMIKSKPGVIGGDATKTVSLNSGVNIKDVK